MRYLLLATLVAGSTALLGCDSSNNQGVDAAQQDQVNANLAAALVTNVINASNDVDTDAPEDIDRINLPLADTAEPVAVNDPNASL